MEFRLLGPLRVDRDGAAIPIGAAKLRTLLAELLLHANQAVPADRLVDVLWNGQPPASGQSSLYNHVMRLRRILGPDGADRVRAVAPGYLIRVEAGELDAQVFLQRCDQGRVHAKAERWAAAAAELAAALRLWSGEPLADVPNIGQHPEVHRLITARAQATEIRIDAELRLGRPDEVIGELRMLVAGQPLSEVFHRQLMLALYRADRPAEALAVFQDLRRTLVDELGVEPSPAVRDLHSRILTGDPGLAEPKPSPASAPPPANSPIRRRGPRHQLPADTGVFTGREPELDELIAHARHAPAATVVISAIDGMAGIGKSALAIHAAHRLRADFPDGQLFLDLHGHTTGLEPLTAEDALDWLLRSLGVPPHAIPRQLDERAALYRHQLADTRTLIVLDNAASSAQLRPLLPGTPGCLVLVTSRRRLTGLDDAHALSLDVLPDTEAVALLHRLAGPGRIPADHDGIGELIALCGRLPLAIRIVAARLRHHRVLRVEDVVEQLRDERDRLTSLRSEDRNLAAVFESSYAALPPAEQVLFRRLGLVPGADVDAYAAANLVDTDVRGAERLLESLLDHNLLTQHAAGRYRCHDLVRLYARQLSDNSPADGAAARLLVYYRCTSQAADHHLARYTRPTGTPESTMDTVDRVAVVAPELPDRASALAWLRAERDNLLAAVEAATDRPADQVALAAAMASFLLPEGTWTQAATIHRLALAAAQASGDDLGAANARHDLGRVQRALGDTAAAEESHQKALTSYQELGNRLGEANAYWGLGDVRIVIGEFAAAAEVTERAVAIFAELGDRRGEAGALVQLAWVVLSIGDDQRAAALRERALTLYRALGDRQGEAEVRYESGAGQAAAGDLIGAAESYQTALALFLELGDRRSEGNTRWNLARVSHAVGDCQTAAALLEQALAIFRELGSRQGEANALWNLGQVRRTTGDYPTAIAVLDRAIAIYQELGNRHGVALAAVELGGVRLALGEFDAATDELTRALAIYQDLGHGHGGVAQVQHGLGEVRLALGDVAAAEELFATALAAYRELAITQAQAMVLNSLGALARATARPAEALERHRQALDLARESLSPLDEARALDGIARSTVDISGPDAALAELGQAVDIYRRIGAAETAAAARYLAELKAGPRQP